MSGIGPIISISSPTVPAKTNGASLSLGTDQAAAKEARAAVVKAAAQLAADQQANAATGVLAADGQALDTANAALATADAKVVADQRASGSLDIVV